jgi:hypothetical protein
MSGSKIFRRSPALFYIEEGLWTTPFKSRDNVRLLSEKGFTKMKINKSNSHSAKRRAEKKLYSIISLAEFYPLGTCSAVAPISAVLNQWVVFRQIFIS